MDAEIIEFLQKHNFMNHKGNCDTKLEEVKKLENGEITLDEFIANHKCDNSCFYWMRHRVKCRLLEVAPDKGEPEVNGCTSTHCFRNLSHSILDSEGKDFSSTFVAQLLK